MKKVLLELCFLIMVSVASYHLAQLRFSLDVEYWGGHASLAELTELKGATPFQYRVLTPWLVDLIRAGINSMPQEAHSPEYWKDKYPICEHSLLSKLAEIQNRNPHKYWLKLL
jgi:hypothetical protein